MPTEFSSENRFLTAPTGRLFAANALPMLLIMTMSGLLNVVDAAFLGHFVGADALTAVSIVFPAVMITIALSTLVSGGMSSLLARRLGAASRDGAAAVFAHAHGLSLFVSLLLIATFAIGGRVAVERLSGGEANVAGMAYAYLSIMIFATPVQFLLGVHADAWRNEGRAVLMAAMSVGVTLANIALNYVLIVKLDFGVAGSAWGTVLAQSLGLVLLVGIRLRDDDFLPLSSLLKYRWTGQWREMLSLGAPLSLSFIGIALVSATVIATLRLTAGEGYSDTVAAYGIVTRILSFAFMPLMAISLAMQAIVGNNVGAGLFRRSDAALRLAVMVSFAYCLGLELLFIGLSEHIGALFVGSDAVVARTGAILRPMVSFYLFSGPVLVLALYFQAAGRPRRAALLTLVRPYFLVPVLIFALTAIWGTQALWFAFPAGDAAVALIAGLIAFDGLKGSRAGTGFGLGPAAD